MSPCILVDLYHCYFKDHNVDTHCYEIPKSHIFQKVLNFVHIVLSLFSLWWMGMIHHRCRVNGILLNKSAKWYHWYSGRSQSNLGWNTSYCDRFLIVCLLLPHIQ
jgi:hypothetical protein